MRRLIRLGLWSGLLAAIGLGLKRLFQPPRPEPHDDRWRGVEPPSAMPPRPSGPVLPIVAPEIIVVGDVDQPGEPEVGTIDPDVPETPPQEAPAKATAPRKATAKKAPTKKAPTKKAPTKKAVAKKVAAKQTATNEPPEPVQ